MHDADVETASASASASASAAADAPAASDAPTTPLPTRVEALLVTFDKPLQPARIADLLGIGLDEGGSKAIDAAVGDLNAVYDDTGRAFRIERVAGGYRLMTRPEFAETVEALRQSRASTRLSQAALETLAIVAYRQPVTRADIEAIRGVACGEVLRNLLERHLVKTTGRAEEVGRPLLYGTTKSFLELFGLSSIRDLPKEEDLDAL